MHIKKKNIFISIIILLLFLICTFSISIFYKVSKETSQTIERGAIRNIIFSESPVFYDDTETIIGVFFDKTHSKYIEYKDIPKNYIKALVASEDGNFFNHPGFDIRAIIRAYLANLKAGKIVQGGSTLTQQTAKNIFKREKRTYYAKIKELIQAILLEKKYTKEEILELYANQFFVTGFGKGLRIASEYFFSKNAEDLDLVEAAFIAGSVKAPYRYNPFIKKTDAEKDEAKRLANQRKDYVLKNMRLRNLISEEEYQEARDKEVPFEEGTVTFRLNVIMDYIREQLETDYFTEILKEQGVDNIATSGIKIYTSVNKEIQHGTMMSIRKHLPILDVELTGYHPGIFHERYFRHTGSEWSEQVGNMPFFGRVTHIDDDPVRPYIVVSWENGGGIIDYEGLREIGDAWVKWRYGSWEDFDNKHIAEFLKNFHVDDLIPISYSNEEENIRSLKLSNIPDIEGGVVIMHKGMVKAMVGGFFNRYFNRAADAQRQLGSIFKPLVYTAALQLKWNNLDPLNNNRDLFKFENTSYIPRPDHVPKSNKVSMVWAGAKSENLATVWLLYHLTDRLNLDEFRTVVRLLDLDREKDETYQEYVRRIRDKYGIIINREALFEAAFDKSKTEIESDLIFNGMENLIRDISDLHYNIDEKLLDQGDAYHREIAKKNFQRLQNLNTNMIKRFNNIRQQFEIKKNMQSNNKLNRDLNDLNYFYLTTTENGNNRIIYSEKQLQFDSLIELENESILNVLSYLNPDDIWLDGMIPSGVIELLQETLRSNFKDFMSYKRYDLEVLYYVPDFRTLVNLLYVKHLAAQMGVSTELDPVLSFPLGANAINILEAARAYHTIMSGSLYPTPPDMPSDKVPIITKIVDREGEIIWEYDQPPQKILSRVVSGQVSDILRMVVEQGTGRAAKDSVKLSLEFENGKLDIPVPSFGKTGTSNNFRNSSYIGFIPDIDRHVSGFDIENGYVVSAYVGYDDNRPMKGEHITIYGSSGALPIWIETANIIVNSSEYMKGIQFADLAFFNQDAPLLNDVRMRPVTVSADSGLPLDRNVDGSEKETVRIFSHLEGTNENMAQKRIFEPFGISSDK